MSLLAATPGDALSSPITRADIAPVSATPAVQPSVLHVQKPVYPELAARRGIQGTVVLEFALRTNGHIRNARIVSADPAGVFDAAALAALRGGCFAPPTAATLHERYRQALEFALTPARKGAQHVLPAAASCRFVTGSRICRAPETDADASFLPNSPHR